MTAKFSQTHFERILAIGPHPDDIELGCFGALSRFKSLGSEVLHFIISDGSVGGQKEKRRKEACASAKIINANVIFGNIKDTAIPDDHSTILLIENVIKEFKPTCIFVNSPLDTHQDHRAVSHATISASRFTPLILYYQTPSSNRSFHPSLYINISDHIENKMKAIRIHESQEKNVYMADRAVKGLADFMALQIYEGGKYYEGFEIYQMILP